MKTGFLTVDYNDGDGSSYRGIEVHVDQKRHHFNTGDPVVDFWDYMQWLSKAGVDYVNCSSSMDHYFMDGAVAGKKRVIELYFHPETHEPMPLGELQMRMLQGDGGYFRLWALKGMKTLEDIKVYVREKKGLPSAESHKGSKTRKKTESKSHKKKHGNP